MNKKERLEQIKLKEDKYQKLVWYARSINRNDDISEVFEHKKDIERLYPTEIKELFSEHSNWQHGYNSGVMAALRYVLTLEEFGIEQAESEFPFLDT